MKPTVEVTETNFERVVVKSDQPVLGEFAPGWSIQSITLDRFLEEITSEYLNYLKVVRVELDQNPSLGLWYGIRYIPTILYFVDGEERVGIFGMTSKEAILSQLKPVISSQRR